MNVKKVWLTAWPTCESLVILSIESAKIEPSHKLLSIRESLFPASPTPTHPQRHVINVGNFERDDLVAIRDAITEHLRSLG
jgi:hypothetical protein